MVGLIPREVKPPLDLCSSCSHAPIQGDQAPLEIYEIGEQIPHVRILEETQSPSHIKLALHLTDGTDGDTQEASHVAATRSSTTLCNIGRHRDGRRSHLSPQSVSLGRWKSLRDLVDPSSELNTLVPNMELPEILHITSSTMRVPSMEGPYKSMGALYDDSIRQVMRPTTYHLQPSTGEPR